jgi:hypothetical protein
MSRFFDCCRKKIYSDILTKNSKKKELILSTTIHCSMFFTHKHLIDKILKTFTISRFNISGISFVIVLFPCSLFSNDFYLFFGFASAPQLLARERSDLFGEEGGLPGAHQMIQSGILN